MKQFGIGVGAWLLCVSVLHAGVTYTAVTQVRDARGRAQSVSEMQVTVDGAKARIDFSKDSGPVPRGGYILTRNAGRTVYMVNPSEQTYMKWDINKLAGMAGNIMEMSGGLLDMSVTDRQSEKLVDEKGPAILGVPTRHYKFRTRYTMAMHVMGFQQKTDIETAQEIWAGQDIADDAAALWKQVISFKSGIGEVDKLIASEIGKIKGLPMKTIVKSTSTDQRGRTESTTTITAVTAIKKVNPPAARFKIPAGFREEKMEVPEQAGGSGDASGDAGDPAAAIKGLLRELGH